MYEQYYLLETIVNVLDHWAGLLVIDFMAVTIFVIVVEIFTVFNDLNSRNHKRYLSYLFLNKKVGLFYVNTSKSSSLKTAHQAESFFGRQAFSKEHIWYNISITAVTK